jgi:ribosomal protein S11
MDPVTAAAIVIGVGATGAAGAAAYSAHEQSSAAKKAAEAQERVGMAQIEASLKAPQLAAETARTKLKAKQAGATQSILTAPGGLGTTEQASTNVKSILGV